MDKPFVQVPLESYESIRSFLEASESFLSDSLRIARASKHVDGLELTAALLASCRTARAELDKSHQGKAKVGL